MNALFCCKNEAWLWFIWTSVYGTLFLLLWQIRSGCETTLFLLAKMINWLAVLGPLISLCTALVRLLLNGTIVDFFYKYAFNPKIRLMSIQAIRIMRRPVNLAIAKPNRIQEIATSLWRGSFMMRQVVNASVSTTLVAMAMTIIMSRKKSAERHANIGLFTMTSWSLTKRLPNFLKWPEI